MRHSLKRAIMAVLMSACWTLIAYSQTPTQPAKPDLSGTWSLDRNRSDVSKSFRDADETIEIKHLDPELRIRRELTFNGKTTEKQFTYFTDGRGETNPATVWLSTSPDPKAPHANETRSKTKWNGARVTTRSTLRTMAGTHAIEEEVVDEWALAADGKTLTRTTRFYFQNNASSGGALLSTHRQDDKRVYSLVSK